MYIVVYHHRHGNDCWPLWDDKEPCEDHIIEQLRENGDWDESDDDRTDTWIEIFGPYTDPSKVQQAE